MEPLWSLPQRNLSCPMYPRVKRLLLNGEASRFSFIHRSSETIEQERTTSVTKLREAEANDKRVQRPQWLVVIGICTHLGFVPIPGAGMIQGGFYCPCHGSHYDEAGRIRERPAPRNLNIPEYHFLDDDTLPHRLSTSLNRFSNKN